MYLFDGETGRTPPTALADAPVREEQGDGLTRHPVLRSAHRHCVESLLWAVLTLSLLVGPTSGPQGRASLSAARLARAQRAEAKAEGTEAGGLL
jgi:hypothetical protein